MLETLVFIAVFVTLGQMWQRLQALEQRLAATEARQEGMPFAPLAREIPVEPEAVPQIAVPMPVAPRPAPAPVFVPEPEPAAYEEAPEQRASPSFNFEDLFGRRLAIWAGGITLAVAGVLVVRYAIEAGLLSPLVRVLAGLLFGTLLIGAAEVALRFERKIADPRVRQALAGAGIATLYASILVAANLYGLIAPLPAFLGLAAVTALAALLSLRFGAPSALLGLVGGLAAPALVGATEPNVPLLTLYLALVVGGLAAVSRFQRWAWLGVAALLGGLGWGATLIMAGMLDTAATLSISAYLLAVGIALPALALPAGRIDRLVRAGGSVVATAQMAALVASGGFSLLHWGQFGLISIALIWLSRREESMRRLPPIGLALALLLAGVWPRPGPAELALVLIAAGLIYGGPALHALWRPRGGSSEVTQIAGIAAGGTFLAVLHFHRFDGSTDLAMAAIALATAAFPAFAAVLGWRGARRREDGCFAALTVAAALLVCVAATFAFPIAFLPFAIAGIAAGLLLFSHRAEDARIEPTAWVLLAIALPLLLAGPDSVTELRRVTGLPIGPAGADAGLAFVRWAGLTCAAAVFAWQARWREARAVAQSLTTLLAYGALAQIIPAILLPIVCALSVVALALTRPALLLPAMGVASLLTVGWAVQPLAHWAGPAMLSLSGEPLLVGDLPALRDTLLRLLAPGLLVGAAAMLARGASEQTKMTGVIVAGVLGGVAAHILFRQILAVNSIDGFVALGLAERTLWQLALLGASIAAWKLGVRTVATALAGAALAHLAWYGLFLHNPLWSAQAVGNLPGLNLLTVLYGLAFAALVLAPRLRPGLPAKWEQRRAVAQMLLIILFALSILRQFVHGSILSVPGLPQGEDIARSILAAGLAIAFLLWGMRTGSRDWRIGSLILMLLAAAKVFLLDASGLEGLMRIGSFVALGISLIGIGWLYSRALTGARPLTAGQ